MSQDRLLNAAIAIVAVCALTLTGVVLFRNTPPAIAAPASLGAVTVDNWKEYAVGGVRMGPATAPVQIVEFADFECPYCATAAGRLDSLRRRYPSQVAVIYRHFPLEQIHPAARPAALAAECAAQQGRFEAFHNTLFAARDSVRARAWTWLATQAGVPDPAALTRCVAANTSAPRLAADIAAANRLGVMVTPTLLVNNQRLDGAPTTAVLDSLVAAQLR